jgi:hypothetical protein
MKYVWWALLAYILYKLVFGFIIPVYKATRQVKKQFRAFNSQMNQYQQEQQVNNPPFEPQSAKPAAPVKKKDYIDFEEL